MPTADVLVTIRPKATPTLDGTTLRNDVQVAVSTSAAGAVVNPDGSITLRFTALDWDTAQTVRVTAVDDAYVDGADLQAFADSAQRVQQIQGPLYVFGGLNPNPDLRDSDIPLAVMLPGESSGTLRLPTSTNLSTIESHQVDTHRRLQRRLRLRRRGHADVDPPHRPRDGRRPVHQRAARPGRHHLRGPRGHRHPPRPRRRPPPRRVDAHRHDARHGRRRRRRHRRAHDRRARRSSRATAATTRSRSARPRACSIPGTIDAIDALLTVDGGAGADTVRVDDRADTTSGVGRLTQTSLTGLDLVARAGLDALYSLTRPATGGFTITIAGVGAVHFAGTETAAQIELALQNLLFAVTVPATGESRTCGRSAPRAAPAASTSWSTRTAPWATAATC